MIVHLSRTLRMRPMADGWVKLYRVKQSYGYKKEIVWLTQEEVRAIHALLPEPVRNEALPQKRTKP